MELHSAAPHFEDCRKICHVGTTLNGLPCVDLSDVNENKLLQWQRVEQTQ